MRSNIRLGRILGIEIGLHYSWFVIAALIVMSLGGHFATSHPEWGQGAIWAIATVTALLFFVSLLAHEMAHSLVARSRGLPVRSITLFALGGVSQIEKESDDAATEFWMAIVGPLSSAAIGAACLGIAWVQGWSMDLTPPTLPLAALVWLGYVNVAIGVFNLVPGYPLDGGRVLRAMLWWATGDQVRATRLASTVGQAVAYLIVTFGLFNVFLGATFNGLWLAFIGWFLLDASRASYARVALGEELRGVRVADVLREGCPSVDGGESVQEFVEHDLLHSGRRCFAVVHQGEVEGLVTPHQVKGLEQPRWPHTRVDQIMQPLDATRAVRPGDSLADTLDLMLEQDVHDVPVVEDGHLRGVLSRGQILEYLQTRAELRGAAR